MEVGWYILLLDRLADQVGQELVLRDLYRDSDDDIVASTTPGAIIDADSRIVEVSVTGPDGDVTLSTILSNVHNI